MFKKSHPLRLAILTFMTVFTPIGVGIMIAVMSMASLMIHKDPAPYPSLAQDLAAPAAGWSAPRRVLVLLSNKGNELTDIAAAYDTFGRLPGTEVRSAASEKKLIPSSGQLAMLADFSFSDEASKQAEILVIPGMMDQDSPQILDAIKARAASAKWILCLGEGARVCAAAGLLENKAATSHFIALADLSEAFPKVRWRNGPAAVADGNIVTSAGIVASIDASLMLIAQAWDKQSAANVASALGYAPQEFEVQRTVRARDALQIFTQSAFHWGKWHLLTWIAPGASELGVAAVIDVLPRTFGFSLSTVSEKRGLLRLAHGLRVVPQEEITTVLPPHALMIPTGTPSGDSRDKGVKWAEGLRIRQVAFNRLPGEAFDESLQWLSDEPNLSIVARMRDLTAKLIALPKLSGTNKLPIEPWFVVRPLLLALLGFLVGNILTRGLTRKNLK